MQKDKTYPATTLTKRQVRRLFDEIDVSTDRGKKERAMLALMYRAGFRVGEVLKLELSDIDWDDDGSCDIHIRHGKGDKDRRVSLDSKSGGFVQEWLEVRDFPETELVFPMEYHKKIERMVAKYAELANIKKRVTPHSLRHTHASELLREGVDMMTIKEQLGHADLGATVKYLSHLNPKERLDKMKGREW